MTAAAAPRLLPRAGSERSGGGLVSRAVCRRCGHAVASNADDTDGRPVMCWTCAESLRPRSTWAGHYATGTFWLETALEHEHRSDGMVLMAHGTLLCRYRPVGPGEWQLVDRLPSNHPATDDVAAEESWDQLT